MKKKIVVLLSVLVLALGAYCYAQPYLTMNEIRNAAKAYDADELNQHIDFVSVRASLKEQLNRRLAQEITGGHDISNPFVMLGTALASGFLDVMIDNYVTPAGIAGLLEGQKVEALPKMKNNNNAPQQAAKNSKEKVAVKAAYQSLNTFNVLVGEEKQQIEFILRRKGLSWQLSNIVLPE